MRVFSFSDQDMEILIDICAPKLRKLHTFLFANKDKNSPYLNNVKVLIDAPILEYLDIEDGCEACYLIKDEPSSLTSAEIDVGPDFFGEADWVPEFFRVFTFCHVTHLVLLSCDDLSKLPEALQRMPKLEFLDVCVVGARKGHNPLEVEEDHGSSDENYFNKEFYWMQSQEKIEGFKDESSLGQVTWSGKLFIATKSNDRRGIE
ncbi:unnamed protein product [Ilex paraguariensis]|uniref:Uncharacterized protein n=1 Tax=Ilex paraguariensis TaxID=185542 RepID=A0ABC8S8R1_9AQUA